MIDNYNLNLSTSLSRIEDIDVAKETLDIIKYKIMLSASRAIQTLNKTQDQQVLELFNSFHNKNKNMFKDGLRWM